MVLLEPIKPFFSLGTKEMRLRLLRERDEGLQMPVANRGSLAALFQALDGEITIPMHAAESLNVAMAGTALLFEAARQRRAPS